MPIPQTDKPHEDIFDLIADASQKQHTIHQADGTDKIENMLDPETIWWKTNLINSPIFGRFAYVLKSYEWLAHQAKNFMSEERARVLSEQILKDVENYKYSVDAKSSETLRDKNNTQNSLVHIATRNKVERQYTLKDDAKKSMWDGIRGRDVEKDNQSA